MALDVYVWVESPGTSLRFVPLVDSIKFGDGYGQDSPSGLNALQEIWDIRHDKVDVAVADEIEAFLRNGMGWKRFEWMPPQRTTALVFKCTAFNRSLTDVVGEVAITATFEQVFQP